MQMQAIRDGKEYIFWIPIHVPEVKFEISKVVEGRATVKATYNGLTKIFLIN